MAIKLTGSEKASRVLPVSRAKLRSWKLRADTLHEKACALFREAEIAMGEDDKILLPLFGDTMLSADELRNHLGGWLE